MQPTLGWGNTACAPVCAAREWVGGPARKGGLDWVGGAREHGAKHRHALANDLRVGARHVETHSDLDPAVVTACAAVLPRAPWPPGWEGGW